MACSKCLDIGQSALFLRAHASAEAEIWEPLAVSFTTPAR